MPLRRLKSAPKGRFDPRRTMSASLRTGGDMVVPRFSSEFLADPGNPIGRYADPEELAEVVEFLCSERNTYTTGAVWSVKGATG